MLDFFWDTVSLMRNRPVSNSSDHPAKKRVSWPTLLHLFMVYPLIHGALGWV